MKDPLEYGDAFDMYLEDDILVIFKLDHHVSRLPVHIPGLERSTNDEINFTVF